MLCEKLTINFKNYLEQLGYSKGSIKLIPSLVKSFLNYFSSKNIEAITSTEIQQFYNYLQCKQHQKTKEALSESYINHHVYSLKIFFNWLEITEQISSNPMSNLTFKTNKNNNRQPLTQHQITQLFNVAKTPKEIATLHLFYSCGLRRSEAERLQITDIHFAKNLLYVRAGKGAKRRVIPLTEKVTNDFLNAANNNKIFLVNNYGNKMTGCNYNNIIKNLAQKATIKSPISLHILWHSIATHLLENGLSIEFIKEFLGHANLETTQLYVKVKSSLYKF